MRISLCSLMGFQRIFRRRLIIGWSLPLGLTEGHIFGRTCRKPSRTVGFLPLSDISPFLCSWGSWPHHHVVRHPEVMRGPLLNVCYVSFHFFLSLVWDSIDHPQSFQLHCCQKSCSFMLISRFVLSCGTKIL